jgi:hypothetical protein
MTRIDEAIAAINSAGPEGQLSYRAAAEKFGVNRVTLARRHRKQTQPHDAAQHQTRLLTPQQEAELVKYIQDLTKRALPPNRDMIKNFVRTIARWEPSDSWVTRFLHRNHDDLTIKWTTGLDRERHQADSEDKYRSYFNLLHSKIEQYDVKPHNIYNMDEKGFLLGVTSRSKRVFSKQLWEQKKVTAALQDGNRDWITVLACICADGSWVDPTIVYEGTAGLREGWLSDLEVGKHQVFFSNTPTGWSNDDLALAWVEQVFDRRTKEKAKRDYRMLLLDGHGSHVTQSFIDYCDRHRILLVVFPPHSTHSLQPLDVVLFSPLAAAYSDELSQFLHRSQGLLDMQKSDFLRLFWAAYTRSFTADNIISGFAATGIHPRDPDVVLKRFKTPPPQRNSDPEIGEVGDGSSWSDILKLYNSAVPDKSTAAAKALKHALHEMQITNELLHHEIQELRGEITTKKRRKKHSRLLNLHQQQEYQSEAICWTPQTVEESRAHTRAEQHQQQVEKLQKKKSRERSKLQLQSIKKRWRQRQRRRGSWPEKLGRRSAM